MGPGYGRDLGAPGHWVMVRPRGEVEAQARDALDALAAANGGTLPARLLDAYDVDPEAFAKLIEALAQLGADVDPELASLARLRPIDEALG